MWECSSQEDDLPLCTMSQAVWKIGWTEDDRPPLLQSYWGSTIHILWSRHVWPLHNKTEESSQVLWSNIHLRELPSSTHWDHSFPWHWFILALRCLIARRGNVQIIFSDNGSNFIGSENELRRALEDKEKLHSFMQAWGGDWVTWKGNPPYASHTGGV